LKQIKRKVDFLIINIENEIQKITPETLKRVSDNMIKRVRLCLENDGKHFDHMLYRISFAFLNITFVN
jgi:hypothetical protein